MVNGIYLIDLVFTKCPRLQSKKKKKKKTIQETKLNSLQYIHVYLDDSDDDKGRVKASDETEIKKFSPPATHILASTGAYSDEDSEIADSDVDEGMILSYVICMNWGCFIV